MEEFKVRLTQPLLISREEQPFKKTYQPVNLWEDYERQ